MRRTIVHCLLFGGLLVALNSTKSRLCAQPVDVLESDDYLDPRYLIGLSQLGIGSRYLVGLLRAGAVTGYRQRTEIQGHDGFLMTAAGQFYGPYFQLSAKGQLLSGSSGAQSAFGRATIEVAGYLPLDSASSRAGAAQDSVEQDLPFRFRLGAIRENRTGLRYDDGWSFTEEGKFLDAGFGSLPAGAGLSLVRFPSRGETSLLYFGKVPLGQPKSWFQDNIDFQYGYTWFKGEHPGVEHNAFKLAATSELLLPGVRGEHDTRLAGSIIPTWYPHRHVRYGLGGWGSLTLPSSVF